MKDGILPFVLIFLCAFIFADKARAHPAWAIAVDARNRIYLSDLEKIWKIDADGTVSVFAERHTHELALDAEGNLLGEEMHYEPSTQKFSAALWRITPEGEFAYTLAPTETPPKGVSIWKNSAGATYYFGQTDNEPREFFLLKRNANGAVEVLLGDEKKALAQPQVVPYSLAGMAFAADGALYFKNADTIWKAAPDDRVSSVAERRQMAPFASALMLFGLAVDGENNVFTADFNSGTVLKISPGGVSAFYRAESEWKPTGVYARNGNLFVLENKNLPPGAKPVVRVRKLAADGAVSTVATIGESQANESAKTETQSVPSPLGEPSPRSASGGDLCVGSMVFAACAGLLAKRN